MARMIVADRDYVLSKYKLHKLGGLENLVAEAVEVNIPFNNYITGFCAFTHKAGIHAKAILANPSTYEIINPADFGLTRYVHFASRLTGWNAIRSRVDQLNLDLTDAQCKECTARVKKLADIRPLNVDDVYVVLHSPRTSHHMFAKRPYFSDSIIRQYHANVKGVDFDKSLSVPDSITADPSEEANNSGPALTATLNNDAARCC